MFPLLGKYYLHFAKFCGDPETGKNWRGRADLNTEGENYISKQNTQYFDGAQLEDKTSENLKYFPNIKY